MNEQRGASVTLRALEGEPLRDDQVRTMVQATAHAIAERQGVPVLRLHCDPDRITVELAADRIVAIGFAAELRRLTTAWYAHKYGQATLWGEAQRDQDDPSESWKRA